MSEQRIVVGYDGSESSRVALTWALAEAAARNAPIVAVHVLDVATGPWASGSARSARTHDEVRGDGERLLLAAQHESRREAPDVELQTRLLEGPTAGTLLEQLADARMVVVGGGGLGELAQLLVGSTDIQLVNHAACPVVVVRSLEYQEPGPEAGRVVVGVDGAERSADVLAFAFEEASVRGTGLTAVHAWQEPFPELPRYGQQTHPGDWTLEVLEQDAQRTLGELLEPWREKMPDVPVRASVVRGEPARQLVAASPGAALVVVGSRGRRGFATLLLGSVGHSVVHHATAPVALVRHRPQIG
jgi:nucleotide-binding universal stress UspA family protein